MVVHAFDDKGTPILAATFSTFCKYFSIRKLQVLFEFAMMQVEIA